jgi:hypothetical protein
MNLSGLLGLKIKDEEMIDVLESYVINKVEYDFDRLQENQPDVYWARAEREGFLLRFNTEQICDVVYCYIQASEGFSPVDAGLVGVTIFNTYEDAEQSCKSNGQSYTVAGPTRAQEWLRVDSGPFKVHYQFKDGALFRITLSSEAPG